MNDQSKRILEIFDGKLSPKLFKEWREIEQKAKAEAKVREKERTKAEKETGGEVRVFKNKEEETNE